MNEKTYADVDNALAAFGAAPIKYRSFGNPVLRGGARPPLIPAAPLPDEPAYDSGFAATPPPEPVPVIPEPPRPVRSAEMPVMRQAPQPLGPRNLPRDPRPQTPPPRPQPSAPAPRPQPQAQAAWQPPPALPPPAPPPPPPAPPPQIRHEMEAPEHEEAVASLFPLLGAAIPESAEVIVRWDTPVRPRDSVAAPDSTWPAPTVPQPPVPRQIPPAQGASRFSAPRSDTVVPVRAPVPAAPPSAGADSEVAVRPEMAREEVVAPPRNTPPPLISPASAVASAAPAPEDQPALAAHAHPAGSTTGRAEPARVGEIKNVARAANAPEPRGDRRSVMEMFRILSAAEREAPAVESRPLAAPGNGENTLFRRL